MIDFAGRLDRVLTLGYFLALVAGNVISFGLFLSPV
jgi:hypothetical protein